MSLKIFSNHIVVIFLLTLSGSLLSVCAQSKVVIQKTVQQQLAQYPASTLQDIYKNFFQDKFGPGHLLTDTNSCRRYIQIEARQAVAEPDTHIVAIGYQHNFYRVGIHVNIPEDVYVKAFIASVRHFRPVSLKAWQKEWRKIDAVIAKMNLHLPNYEQDRKNLQQMLQSGQSVVHHSDLFNQTYHPHYRIIERKIFEKEILPLLGKNKNIK